MSRHEGVSCDSCLKGNFRGRRFKCLICYDYDLCAACFESGAVTTRHATDHPMQCILTRSDFDLYYSGEALSSEVPQAFTCPYCGRMGHTEASLQEHVAAEHAETAYEVICPICASLPGGDPNLVTDDFAGHLTLEHRSGPRDLISFLDEPTATRHSVRRIPQSVGRGGVRPRRSNMHFSSSGGLSPSSRDTVDPIAELLSQLSGVRRTAGQNSTLQQLQIQLQLERQQVRAARQQLERLPRRQTPAAVPGCAVAVPATAPVQETPTQTQPHQSQFLLSRCAEESRSDSELQDWEQEHADRSLFVQELFLSTLVGIEALGTPSETSKPLPAIAQSSSNSGPGHQSWSQSGSSEATALASSGPTIVSANARTSNLDSSPAATGTNNSNNTPSPASPGTSNSNSTSSSTASGMSNSNSSSSTSGASSSSAKRPARQLPTPHNAGPRPLPHQGSGGGVGSERNASGRGMMSSQPVRQAHSVRPAARKPVRPVEGRNQATEPPPPH